MTPHELALSDLLWTTAPLRNVLKGDARAAFVASWLAGTDTLCHGHFNKGAVSPTNSRAAGVELHRLCLDACAALNVRPHELTQQFNDKADGGFSCVLQPTDALTVLGRSVLRTAAMEFPVSNL